MDESDKINKLSDLDRKIWENYVSDEGLMPEDENDCKNFEMLLEGENDIQRDDMVEENSEPSREIDLEKSQKPCKQNNLDMPAQLDRRTEEKLRKGKMTIDARLDLHGLNRTQAHQRLVRFLIACHQEDLRCVLVITGKGKSQSTSGDWLTPSKGVLKENVPLWLNEGVLKKIVLKFFKAQPKDGGSGALYVYIRRNR